MFFYLLILLFKFDFWLIIPIVFIIVRRIKEKGFVLTRVPPPLVAGRRSASSACGCWTSSHCASRPTCHSCRPMRWPAAWPSGSSSAPSPQVSFALDPLPLSIPPMFDFLHSYFCESHNMSLCVMQNQPVFTNMDPFRGLCDPTEGERDLGRGFSRGPSEEFSKSPVFRVF